jgi:uncharacterized protein (TIGR03437 family)
MIAIFGRNLGPASIALAQSFPLPRNLGGTAARLTAGGANYDLILTYSVASQVGAIIPSNTPVGAAQLTVTFNGQTSANFAVNIVRSSFGIFTANQGGSGPAIAQNFNSQTDQPINSILNAARPGQTITLWAPASAPSAATTPPAPRPATWARRSKCSSATARPPSATAAAPAAAPASTRSSSTCQPASRAACAAHGPHRQYR